MDKYFFSERTLFFWKKCAPERVCVFTNNKLLVLNETAI